MKTTIEFHLESRQHPNLEGDYLITWVDVRWRIQRKIVDSIGDEYWSREYHSIPIAVTLRIFERLLEIGIDKRPFGLDEKPSRLDALGRVVLDAYPVERFISLGLIELEPRLIPAPGSDMTYE